MGSYLSSLRFNVRPTLESVGQTIVSAVNNIRAHASWEDLQSSHRTDKTNTSAASAVTASSTISSVSLPPATATEQEQHQSTFVQSIPVGQSLDAPDEPVAQPHEPHPEPLQHRGGDQLPAQQVTSKQSVEEAVIKIQALVRGHLARKALRGADGLPPLGQRQFDEQSLTQNAPSPIFSSGSPFSIVPAASESVLQQHRQSLGPIAEVSDGTESAGGVFSEAVYPPERDATLSTHSLSMSPSPETIREPSTPLEASASIDLGSPSCETPASASASIDIRDYYSGYVSVVNPSGGSDKKMATVLHHRIEPSAPPSTATSSVSREVLGTPPSAGDPEAAAIRIQSAFRGYRTRKNSPMKNRSQGARAPTVSLGEDANNETTVTASSFPRADINLAPDRRPADSPVAGASHQLDRGRVIVALDSEGSSSLPLYTDSTRPSSLTALSSGQYGFGMRLSVGDTQDDVTSIDPDSGASQLNSPFESAPSDGTFSSPPRSPIRDSTSSSSPLSPIRDMVEERELKDAVESAGIEERSTSSPPPELIEHLVEPAGGVLVATTSTTTLTTANESNGEKESSSGSDPSAPAPASTSEGADNEASTTTSNGALATTGDSEGDEGSSDCSDPAPAKASTSEGADNEASTGLGVENFISNAVARGARRKKNRSKRRAKK